MQENKEYSSNLLKLFLEKLEKVYEKSQPEKQFILSVLAEYIFLGTLIDPNFLPNKFQPILEVIDSFTLGTIGISVGALFALVGSADGIRRIIIHKLPFYKIYFQVFFLQNFDNKKDE